MQLEGKIIAKVAAALQELYGHELEQSKVKLQPTRKDFEGTLTLVTFPFSTVSKKSPEDTGREIGGYLKAQMEEVADFNVVKGFLNLVISDRNWVNTLVGIAQNPDFGVFPDNGQRVVVEYSSPNTNKPLHLGHLRNNFLGYSVALIMQANGYESRKVNLVNDRGIHICKSMLAYTKDGRNLVPSRGEKGDKLVGRFYVEFDKMLKEQAAPLLEQVAKGDLSAFSVKAAEEIGKLSKLLEKAEQDLATLNADPEVKGKLLKAAKKKVSGLKGDLKQAVQNQAPIMEEAREMLKKWEQGDEGTVALWQKMNAWVYDGFDVTYKNIGVDFDKIYYESETYLLGKDIVEEGLEKGIFHKKDDGSVWIDLSGEGLDEKLVLRADGTAVYITQDMGTADLRYQDFSMQQSLYVVGNEQDYHFSVLKVILQKLGRPYADGIFHLSYGMVDLPSGKMKSREGTVVDADDLVQEMMETAKSRTQALGKIEGFTPEEAEKLYHQLAMGALKYYLLKVDPKKRMLFDPKESIDFQGNTGVYIQYNFAKINAVVRKAKAEGIDFEMADFAALQSLEPSEVSLIEMLATYPDKVAEAGKGYAPSIIANFAYDLAKTYSKFYADLPILADKDATKVAFRVLLSSVTASVLEKAMNLLGVEMPQRM